MSPVNAAPTVDAWNVADPTVCPVCQRDGCDDDGHLPPPPPPDGDTSHDTARQPGLRAVPALELMTAPPPVSIVEGVAFADRLTVIASESGAGKTFILLDLAGAVSEGTTWHGRTIGQGSVLYVSFEGDALSLRLRALTDTAHRGIEHVYIVRATDPLSPHVTPREGEQASCGEFALMGAITALCADLAAAARPPIVLVVIDTVRASMTGSEDSSEHASAYLRAVRRILATVPGAAGILAHHAGWQDGQAPSKRERGSSAWRGNCDVTLYLEAGAYDTDQGATPLTVRTLKVRDLEVPAPLRLLRRRVEVSVCDAYGFPLTSCVIDRDTRTKAATDATAERAAAATEHEIDLKVLRAVRDRHVTSQEILRACVRLGRELVTASVARVVGNGWMEPPRQRSPFVITPAGRTIVAEAK